MAEHLEPPPVEYVLAIVEERRLRRHRLALRGGLGAGAVLAVGAGAWAAGSDLGNDPATPIVPATPSSTSATTATTAGGESPDPVLEPWHIPAHESFLEEGFQYDDAVRLAEAWNVDPYAVKVAVGEALRTGSPPGAAALDDDAGAVNPATTDAFYAALYQAFDAAGHTYADAVEIAELWGVDDSGAKAMIGARELAGQPLHGT